MLSACGIEQTLVSRNVANASSSAAVPPSVAKPCPQVVAANRHPTSTAGRIAGRNRGTDSPT